MRDQSLNDFGVLSCSRKNVCYIVTPFICLHACFGIAYVLKMTLDQVWRYSVAMVFKQQQTQRNSFITNVIWDLVCVRIDLNLSFLHRIYFITKLWYQKKKNFFNSTIQVIHLTFPFGFIFIRIRCFLSLAFETEHLHEYIPEAINKGDTH